METDNLTEAIWMHSQKIITITLSKYGEIIHPFQTNNKSTTPEYSSDNV